MVSLIFSTSIGFRFTFGIIKALFESSSFALSTNYSIIASIDFANPLSIEPSKSGVFT